MRLNQLLAVSLLLGTPALIYAADPAPIINPVGGTADALNPAELPANSTTDQILDALDQRGKNMREFTAKVSLTSGDKDIGDLSTRVGRLSVQKKADDTTQLRVQFDKRIVGRVTRDEKTEYLLNGRWLTDRDYGKKIENIREIAQPGQKIDLLKLGEGPFPLPIGQDKAEVHKQFEVKLIPPAKDEPPNTVHIELKPLRDTRFFQRFKAIQVWVDRKTNFPVQIITTARDGSDEHVTQLEDVRVNPPGGLKPEDFKLPTINPQDWSQHTEPYRE